MRGSIRNKIDDKGYGFIRAGNGKEYFFHTTQCRTPFVDLNPGDEVEFNIEESKKGPRACDVERI